MSQYKYACEAEGLILLLYPRPPNTAPTTNHIPCTFTHRPPNLE